MEDFIGAVSEYIKRKYGKKANGIYSYGDLALTNLVELAPHQKPLQAKNADQLVQYIKWCSTQTIYNRGGKMSEIMNTPGGEMAKRPLEFFFLCDCSGSMYGDKIESLNHAIHGVTPAMQNEAKNNPSAQMFVRAVKFSDGAQWHLGAHTEVENFSWVDLEAGGVTDMGAAFELVSKELEMPPMASRGLTPVLVLISDGFPTDNWKAGLQTLMDKPWADKSIRIAIAIGDDFDLHPLKSFTTGDPSKADALEMSPHQVPLIAKNADQLTKYIKWASTAVQRAASAPPSKPKQDGSTPAASVTIAPPVVAASSDDDEVW